MDMEQQPPEAPPEHAHQHADNSSEHSSHPQHGASINCSLSDECHTPAMPAHAMACHASCNRLSSACYRDPETTV